MSSYNLKQLRFQILLEKVPIDIIDTIASFEATLMPPRLSPLEKSPLYSTYVAMHFTNNRNAISDHSKILVKNLFNHREYYSRNGPQRHAPIHPIIVLRRKLHYDFFRYRMDKQHKIHMEEFTIFKKNMKKGFIEILSEEDSIGYEEIIRKSSWARMNRFLIHIGKKITGGGKVIEKKGFLIKRNYHRNEFFMKEFLKFTE